MCLGDRNALAVEFVKVLLAVCILHRPAQKSVRDIGARYATAPALDTALNRMKSIFLN